MAISKKRSPKYREYLKKCATYKASFKMQFFSEAPRLELVDADQTSDGGTTKEVTGPTACAWVERTKVLEHERKYRTADAVGKKRTRRSASPLILEICRKNLISCPKKPNTSLLKHKRYRA